MAQIDSTLEMSALERLNQELSYPGQGALYLAARKMV